MNTKNFDNYDTNIIIMRFSVAIRHDRQDKWHFNRKGQWYKKCYKNCNTKIVIKR